MPEYVNRPPLAQGTCVSHYTTIEAVFAMLRDQQLRLVRVDTWPDPFEGSVPKQQIDCQTSMFSGASRAELDLMGMGMGMEIDLSDTSRMRSQPRDPWTTMTKRRRAMTLSAHAICWRVGEESEAMWRLYCKGGTEAGRNDRRDRGQPVCVRGV